MCVRARSKTGRRFSRVRDLPAPTGGGAELAEQRRSGRLRRAYRIEDGIPVLLIDEARDVDDDEHARLMARARPADPR